MLKGGGYGWWIWWLVDCWQVGLVSKQSCTAGQPQCSHSKWFCHKQSGALCFFFVWISITRYSKPHTNVCKDLQTHSINTGTNMLTTIPMTNVWVSANRMRSAWASHIYLNPLAPGRRAWYIHCWSWTERNMSVLGDPYWLIAGNTLSDCGWFMIICMLHLPWNKRSDHLYDAQSQQNLSNHCNLTSVNIPQIMVDAHLTASDLIITRNTSAKGFVPLAMQVQQVANAQFLLLWILYNI